MKRRTFGAVVLLCLILVLICGGCKGKAGGKQQGQPAEASDCPKECG
jgi:hypothetical protein